MFGIKELETKVTNLTNQTRSDHVAMVALLTYILKKLEKIMTADQDLETKTDALVSDVDSLKQANDIALATLKDVREHLESALLHTGGASEGTVQAVLQKLDDADTKIKAISTADTAASAEPAPAEPAPVESAPALSEPAPTDSGSSEPQA